MPRLSLPVLSLDFVGTEFTKLLLGYSPSWTETGLCMRRYHVSVCSSNFQSTAVETSNRPLSDANNDFLLIKI